MKKILIIVSILIITIISTKEYEKILIPKDSIRIRVIANSNSIEDQLQKIKVKEKLEKKLYTNLTNVKNVEEARKKIKESIPELNKIVSETINNSNFSINYGNNFFPEKILNGIKYEEGHYESLAINIGASQGNNWWCVLFPPLCMIDVNDNDTDFVEYKSKVLEILNKYK